MKLANRSKQDEKFSEVMFLDNLSSLYLRFMTLWFCSFCSFCVSFQCSFYGIFGPVYCPLFPYIYIYIFLHYILLYITYYFYYFIFKDTHTQCMYKYTFLNKFLCIIFKIKSYFCGSHYVRHTSFSIPFSRVKSQISV